MKSNMDIFKDLNRLEEVEVTAEEIKEAADIKQDIMLSDYMKQAPRSLKRKFFPKEKFGNKLMQAFQNKNKQKVK